MCPLSPPDAAVHKVSRRSVDGLNIDSRYLNLLQESAVVSAPPLSAPPSASVCNNPALQQTNDNYCLLHRQSSVAVRDVWFPGARPEFRELHKPSQWAEFTEEALNS